MNWIQGSKFQSLADWTYAPKEKAQSDYIAYENTLDTSKLRDFDIIYTQGFHHYKKELINLIRDTKPVFLISHNCDNGIDESYDIPDNVVTWYTNNKEIYHPKVEPIPTGLENDIRDFGVHKKEKMLQKIQENKDIRNLVYIDCSTEVNREERSHVYKLLDGKNWVTMIKNKAVSFDTYLDNLYNHQFAICPPGNGITTHRPWEAMYVGTIPIMRRNPSNTMLADMPICFVSSWEEINMAFLEREYCRIKNMQWNRNKLTFDYWRDYILYERIFARIYGKMTYPRIYSEMINEFSSGSTFVEVGSYLGKSLSFLLKEIHKSGKTFNIFAVDNFSGVVGDPFSSIRDIFYSNMFSLKDKFTFFEQDSVQSANNLKDGSVDFVFIDANHEKPRVKRDILAWLPKVRKGGIIAGHDFSDRYCGLMEAVGEVFGDRIDLKYINEFCWMVRI